MNAYETDLKYRRDWKNAMDFAVEKTVKETAEKTAKKTSREKQVEIAKNLKQANVPVDIIAQSTGLTVKKINAL